MNLFLNDSSHSALTFVTVLSYWYRYCMLSS